jgi:hypothetical protein
MIRPRTTGHLAEPSTSPEALVEPSAQETIVQLSVGSRLLSGLAASADGASHLGLLAQPVDQRRWRCHEPR